MAKEIPYFKFSPTDWLTGDITLEDYELQGIFINIAAYYWSKECELSLVNLKKRFRGLDDKINELIDNKIVKVIQGNVVISFLNEQLNSKELQSAVNKMNGRKGGRPKKEKTENKPNGLIFDNRNETHSKPIDKEKDIENKKEIYNTQVVPTLDDDNSIKNNKIIPEKDEASKFVDWFNTLAERNFRSTKKIKGMYNSRLKEKYTKNDIVTASKNAHNEKYHVETNFKNLTPEFILRVEKLEMYKNVLKSNLNNSNGIIIQTTN